MKFAIALGVMVQLIASCVAPTPSTPPDAALPQVYRGGALTTSSLGAMPWRQLYEDPVLQGLIEKALVHNFDVEIAYTAILEAEARLGITAANQSVFVNGNLQAPYQATAGNKPPGTPDSEFYPQLGIGASYQVDLFGKLASATGAARNRLLSTDAAKNTVLATVVAQVASAYFQLRELDEVLKITQQAVPGRQENVRLMKLRVEGGESSAQDLRQAEQSLYEVTQNEPAIRQEIAKTENALAVLTGDYPHDIQRGLPLQKQVTMPAVPPTGVASELLQRRPDIIQAEYAIAAAAGDVDVARKLLYPSLTLGASAAAAGSIVHGEYVNESAPAALQPSTASSTGRSVSSRSSRSSSSRSSTAARLNRRFTSRRHSSSRSPSPICKRSTEPSKKSPTTSSPITNHACGRTSSNSMRALLSTPFGWRTSAMRTATLRISRSSTRRRVHIRRKPTSPRRS